jgi:hypothetical protein
VDLLQNDAGRTMRDNDAGRNNPQINLGRSRCRSIRVLILERKVLKFEGYFVPHRSASLKRGSLLRWSRFALIQCYRSFGHLERLLVTSTGAPFANLKDGCVRPALVKWARSEFSHCCFGRGLIGFRNHRPEVCTLMEDHSVFVSRSPGADRLPLGAGATVGAGSRFQRFVCRNHDTPCRQCRNRA